MAKKIFLSVVVPAYNEQTRIAATLLDIDRHLKVKGIDYEIIVALSPSEDQTRELLMRLKPGIEKMKVLELKKNRGKGAAIKAGVQVAKGGWLLYMDADNSTSIVEFGKMQPHMSEYEFIIASRFLKNSIIDQQETPLRRIFGWAGRVLAKLSLGLKASDPQCGFKLLSIELAQRLSRLSILDGWLFDSELLYLAKKMGYSVKEVPVHWSHSRDSHVSTSSYWSSLKELKTLKSARYDLPTHFTRPN
ncbi:MAG: glycosyltransferase [Candidatus Harrisonbacteria bacterium]|nr:glycosyltransferase [Candidatus Harrisonbacteria bacterium]